MSPRFADALVIESPLTPLFSKKYQVRLVLRTIGRLFCGKKISSAQAACILSRFEGPPHAAGLCSVKIRHTGNEKMKLQYSPLRVVGLNESLPAHPQRLDRTFQIILENCVQAFDILRVSWRDEQVPIE